jgi:hypothetical protein
MTTTWSQDDKIIVIEVSGILTKPEFDICQSEIEPIIQEGQAGILILVSDFKGWGGDADEWADLSFQERNDPFMRKLAIVGDEKWRDLATMFAGQGLRRFPIEYFKSGQEALARAWLE